MSGGPFERIGDSVFSLDATNRYLCDCDEHADQPADQRGVMTRAELLVWAKANMPNGRCICYPERGIVCGQHRRRLDAE